MKKGKENILPKWVHVPPFKRGELSCNCGLGNLRLSVSSAHEVHLRRQKNGKFDLPSFIGCANRPTPQIKSGNIMQSWHKKNPVAYLVILPCEAAQEDTTPQNSFQPTFCKKMSHLLKIFERQRDGQLSHVKDITLAIIQCFLVFNKKFFCAPEPQSIIGPTFQKEFNPWPDLVFLVFFVSPLQTSPIARVCVQHKLFDDFQFCPKEAQK